MMHVAIKPISSMAKGIARFREADNKIHPPNVLQMERKEHILMVTKAIFRSTFMIYISFVSKWYKIDF